MRCSFVSLTVAQSRTLSNNVATTMLHNCTSKAESRALQARGGATSSQNPCLFGSAVRCLQARHRASKSVRLPFGLAGGEAGGLGTLGA